MQKKAQREILQEKKIAQTSTENHIFYSIYHLSQEVKVRDPVHICLQKKHFCSTRNTLNDFDEAQTLVSLLEFLVLNGVITNSNIR